MHFAISATWGPTDPTRAALPFVFAASALQAGDSVLVMLFHDAVHLATQGTAETLVPFGPPQRFQEVISHPNAKVLVCKPCVLVRHISETGLDKRITMAGMNEFHASASRSDARVVCF
jgi:tRNA 2-thiouridine synthesizing protein D